MIDYTAYQEKDFLMDEHFRDWVLQPNPENCSFWESWLAHYPEKGAVVMRAKGLLLSLQYTSKQISKDKKDKIFREVIGHKRIYRPTNVFNWQAAAVWGGLLLAFTALLYAKWPDVKQTLQANQLSDTLEQQWLVRETQQAERITLRLSDGTVVKLNSQSRISIPQPFVGDKREAYLEGEAYFQVASDPFRPFYVYTDEIVTEVVGTSFNILHHPNRKRTEVAVETGKVRVRGNFPEGVYDLAPSEKLLCTPEAVKKGHFNYDRVFGWKDGLLCFEQADFQEIAFRLARWYGCQVIYDKQAMEGRRFSGKFKNQTLNEILKGISYASGFTYRIENNKVFIYHINEKLPM